MWGFRRRVRPSRTGPPRDLRPVEGLILGRSKEKQLVAAGGQLPEPSDRRVQVVFEPAKGEEIELRIYLDHRCWRSLRTVERASLLGITLGLPMPIVSACSARRSARSRRGR